MKLNINLICVIMALNNDWNCLLLNKMIYYNKPVFYLYLNEIYIFKKAILNDKYEQFKHIKPFSDLDKTS